MSPPLSINISAALREDFVEIFGWDAAVRELGGEQKGMRDTWTAIEFSRPKGAGATFEVRLHPLLLPVLRSMLEVRWADHFAVQGELEGPYYRVIEQITKMTRVVKANKKKR